MAHDERANQTNNVDTFTIVCCRVVHPVFSKVIQGIDPPVWTHHRVIDDTSGNLLHNDNALGGLSVYASRPNGLVVTSTDGNGRVSRFTYDASGFLIAQFDAATSTIGFAVSALG